MGICLLYETLEAARKAPIPPEPGDVTGRENWQIAYRYVDYADERSEEYVAGYSVQWEDGNRTRSARMLAFIKKHCRICFYCGRKGEADQGPDGRLWQRDHVLPKSRGGKGLRGNIVLACGECNRAKGTLAVEVFLRQCGRPNALTKRRPRQALRAVLHALDPGEGKTAAELARITEMAPEIIYETLELAAQDPPLVYAIDSWFDFGLRWFPT